MTAFFELLGDHTLQTVMFGSLILGITAGSLGAFAVLRQQSLLGDAISHATLPGVAGAFLLTQSKHPLVLLVGAALTGWLGTLWVKFITENTRVKKDAALGIVLSVFFGMGLVLLTIVQRLPTATKAGLDTFLFGNASTLLKSDVHIMLVISLIVFLLLAGFWKEFKLISFDQDFAKSQGLPVHALDVLLTTLIVVAIVIGLQTVGVVLMSAMIVAPAAAARQWTDRLSVMIGLAALFGAVSGVGGAIASSLVTRLPTGPTIVIVLSFFVFLSLLLAPNRGLLWDWLRYQKNRERILTATMLKNLLLFSEISTDPYHPHDIAALDAIGRAAVNKRMRELEEKGYVQQAAPHRWALTPQGFKVAQRLTKEYEEQFNV